MDFHLIAAQLLNGVALGAILALVALGLTIVFGLLGFVNFAHGAIFTCGAYAGWVVYTKTGSFVLGIGAALVVAFAIGVVIERLLIRTYYNRPPEDQILVTFGLAIVLVETIRALFTGQTQLLSPQYRLEVVAIVAVTLAAIYLIIYRTKIGLIVRAGIDDPLIVNLLGIDVKRTFLLVFAMGAALAGFAGIIDSPMLAVNPDMGTEVLAQSFVVIVIGGVGSFGGAILGGLIAGELISITTLIAPDYSQAFLYVAMALVLILRPKGLFGVEGRA